MEWPGHNLRIGSQGEAVRRLQTELLELQRLKPELELQLPAEECRSRRLGGGTQDAVAAFQKSQGLEATGIVDQRTAALLGKTVYQLKVAEAQARGYYHIRGHVLSRETREGIGGLEVRAFDVHAPERALAATTTRESGLFAVQICKRDFIAFFGEEREPELFFRVFGAGELLCSTQGDVEWKATEPLEQPVIFIDVPAEYVPPLEPPIDRQEEREENYQYLIQGTVVSQFPQGCGAGLPGLRVSAHSLDDPRLPLASATTQKKGAFQLRFDQETCFKILGEYEIYEVFFRVHSGDNELVSTEDDVLWDIREPDTQVTIVVPLVQGSGDRLREQHIVHGTVFDEDGRPAGRIVVSVAEQCMVARGATRLHELGRTMTDAHGQYAVRYAVSSLANPARGAGDLVVRVLLPENDEPLAVSPVFLDAPDDLCVNLSIGDEAPRGPTEFDRVSAALSPALRDITLEALSPRDCVVLSNQTGIPVERVQLFAESHRQVAHVDIDAFILYALYRTGMPLSLPALTIQTSADIISHLKQAGERNIIRAMTQSKLSRACEILHNYAHEALLSSDSRGRLPAAQLMERAGLSAAEQREVVTTLAEASDHGTLWEKLESGSVISKTKAAKLRKTLEFDALSLHHAPLRDRLLATTGLNSVRQLALGGLSDKLTWLEFLKEGGTTAPDSIPGDGPEAKLETYALCLARLVESAYPSEAFAATWSGKTMATVSSQPLLDKCIDLGYRFETENIGQFITDHPQQLGGLASDDAVLELQATQNLYRITPRFDKATTVSVLLNKGIQSSYQIKRIGEEKLAVMFEAEFDPAVIHEISCNAIKYADFTLVSLAKFVWDTQGPSPFVIEIGDLASDKGRAQLAELFGTLDFCHCEHCRSVLGPAAYLVDLLAFLDGSQGENGKTGLDVLLARRGDIGDIPLSCANTNTPVPYIDLVNEVLECRTVPGMSITGLLGKPLYDKDLTAAQLRAHPALLRTEAYEVLRDAVFPWNLPFHLWNEEARAYLRQIGVTRHELMGTFSTTPAVAQSSVDVSCERLRIDPIERDLLLQPPTNTKGRAVRWGFPETTTGIPSRVSNALTFLEKTQLAYEDLTALLQCRFVNPVSATKRLAIAFSTDHPCSLEFAKITGLTAAGLNRVEGFVRLHRQLGWPLFELDRVLSMLGKTSIDEETLVALAHVSSLDEQLNSDRLTIAQWWAKHLDANTYEDSQARYDELFQSSTVGKQDEATLTALRLNKAGTGLEHSPAPTILSDNLVPVVLAAARIARDELEEILDHDLTGGATQASFASLSYIVRLATFARALHLSIGEYYLLRDLSGIVPITTPEKNGSVTQTASPADTLRFVEVRKLIETAGLRLAELAYLLAHDTSQPQNGSLLDEALQGRAVSLLSEVQAIRAAYEPDEEEAQSVLASALIAFLPDEAALQTGMDIILGISSLSASKRSAWVTQHLSTLIPPADAKAKLVTSTTQLPVAKDRMAFVLEHLFRFEAKRLLVQKLSESLGVATDAMRVLLGRIVDPLNAGTSAKSALLVKPLVDADGELQPTDAQLRVYEGLYKAARLLALLDIAPSEQSFIVDHGEDVGWPNVAALPLAHIQSGAAVVERFRRLLGMVEAYHLWPRIRTSGGSLGDFLRQARKLSKSAIQGKLAADTPWPTQDIAYLVSKYGFSAADLKKSAWLVQLYKAFSLLRQLGVGAAQAWHWNAPSLTAKHARQIKLAVQSKYEEDAWLTVAPEIRDPLRKRQRDALLAYVFHDLRGKMPDVIQDVSDVYGHLLIDPEMSSCMDTSRVKLAISSVQLFVQRVLMNLEEDAITFSHADVKQWEWRKNYRIWEANRKVFLWPENWIYPELNPQESIFLKEFRDELSQADITNETAETALMSYLRKLDEVAHVDVCGTYEETDDAGRKILHVVARTHSSPHQYFYRRWFDRKYWTPWEHVDADIEGDHLLPVIHNRRLFLFWPKFIEKAVEQTTQMTQDVNLSGSDSHVTADPPNRYYEIRMGWTQYRHGQWQEARISSAFVETGKRPVLRPKGKFYFHSQKSEDGDLLLHVVLPSIPVYAASAFRYIAERDELEVADLSVFDPTQNYLGATAPLVQQTVLGKLPDIENTYMWFRKTDKPAELSMPTQVAIPSVSPHETPLLKPTKQAFCIMLPHQYPSYSSQAPFFLADRRRVLFCEPRDIYLDMKLAATDLHFTVDGATYFTPIDVTLSNAALSGISDFRLNPDELNQGRPALLQTFAADSSGLVVRFDPSVSANLQPDVGRTAFDVAWAGRPVLNVSTPIEVGAVTFEPSSDISTFATTLGQVSTVGKVWVGKDFLFRPFYHPYVPLMVKQLNRFGVPGLLAPTSDHGPDYEGLLRQSKEREYFNNEYGPTKAVLKPYPKDEFDFSEGGPYSQYNWELFFHAPLIVAERLMQNQRFEEAMRWFQYIFDPTETVGKCPQRFWKIKPFTEYDKETSIVRMMDMLNGGDPWMESQLELWEDDPFNPHLIASMRHVAYMRKAVMTFIDNLIAWGDYLFRQDSIESINEATQLYVLATQILGRRPVRVDKADVSSKTFVQLKPLLDEFSNARVKVESMLPWMTTYKSNGWSGATGILDTLYYCIPENEKLLSYWDTVADRLFKIRNCMNIEGVVRKLALFQPPIDPGLLVKARAAGLDLSQVLADLNAPLPYYRFHTIWQHAYSVCSDVCALGSALLQALEKKDEAKLGLIRATHQVDLLNTIRDTKLRAKEEAALQKEALIERSKLAEIRQAHYEGLEYTSAKERAAVDLHYTSVSLQESGIAGEICGAMMALMPTYQIGASGVGGSPHVSVMWGSQNMTASQAHKNATFFQKSSLENSMAAIMEALARYERRQEDWDLQIGLAEQEQLDTAKQLLASDIRIAIADADIRTHDKQIDHAEEEAAFLEDRYTGEALYSWMVTQTSTLYFQAYQLAYDSAKSAELCFRHELGIADSQYIQFGYWDSLKKGLLAGERLKKDLHRLKSAYLERSRRELEITQSISLARINPAALVQLRETGTCTFSVPEVVFDAAYPGQYMRRIKSVSLSIPCVLGPYENVPSKLALLSSRVRTRPTLNDYVYKGIDDTRFVHDPVGIQSIATSSAQRDSGLFQLSFGDERYLPFEGAGAISEWSLQLPPTELPPFDYDTISDVILHIQYTARDGGEPLRTAAINSLESSLNKVADVLADDKTGLKLAIGMSSEFPSQLHRFLHPEADQTKQQLSVPLSKSLFPYMLSKRKLHIDKVQYLLLLEDSQAYAQGANLPVNLVLPGGGTSNGDLVADPTAGNQPGHTFDTNLHLEDTPLSLTLEVQEQHVAALAPELTHSVDSKERLNPDAISDLVLLVNYTIEP